MKHQITVDIRANRKILSSRPVYRLATPGEVIQQDLLNAASRELLTEKIEDQREQIGSLMSEVSDLKSSLKKLRSESLARHSRMEIHCSFLELQLAYLKRFFWADGLGETFTDTLARAARKARQELFGVHNLV